MGIAHNNIMHLGNSNTNYYTTWGSGFYFRDEHNSELFSNCVCIELLNN